MVEETGTALSRRELAKHYLNAGIRCAIFAAASYIEFPIEYANFPNLKPTSKLDEACQTIVEVYGEYKDYVEWLRTIQNSESQNEAGPRVFWSGGRTAEQTAIGWAKANNGQTVYDTVSGQRALQQTAGMDAAQAESYWIDPSREFAQGAYGKVHVFQDGKQTVRLNSIWAQVEYPTLKGNPNVTSIIYHVLAADD